MQTLRTAGPALSFRVLVMSATWSSADALGLDAADLAHPVLAPRLTRPKPLTIRDLEPDEDLVGALVREARRLRREGAGVIGVIANRVRDARAVFRALGADAEAVLLTGRVRPADRDALLADYLRRMAAGSRAAGRAPLYVVATETIEVGADLDFDALVTESAPLSALRQRAGRLNRLGELDSAPMVIVHRALSDQEKQRRSSERTRGTRRHHSLYREAAEEARKWLKKHKVQDFGIQVMERHPVPPEPSPPSPDLLAAHLDLLSCTSSAPGIDPAPWLHGYTEPERSVFLCWRRDAAVETVELAPPVQQEILEVPEDSDWRALARTAGMARPGRVLAYPGGALVLAASETDSAAGVRPVALAAHLKAVGERTRRLAESAGLPPELREAATSAGAGHDHGKGDARWQARVRGTAASPLAKGPRGGDPWLSLPPGWRHEMASAVAVDAEPLVRLDYQDLKALMLGLDRLRRTEREALGIRVWFARYLRTHQSSGRLGWASEVARTPSAGKNPGGSRTAQVPGFMIL